MTTKEQLRKLIETIKKETALGQEEISVAAGYKPKTITQRLSNGKELDAVYNRLKIVFKDRLNGSTHTTKFTNDRSGKDDIYELIQTLDEKLKAVASNSDETNLLVKAILTSQIGYSEAIGNTLDRVAKLPAGTTAEAAGTIEQRIWKMLQEKGIDAIVRR